MQVLRLALPTGTVFLRALLDEGGAAAPAARLLQHLTATQRAVLIPREVLGFSAAEVADQLDTSIASVNSVLQRARKVIDSAAPTQQTVLRELSDEAVGAIVARWTDAWHKLENNAFPNGGLALPDSFLHEPGMLLGYDKLNGDFAGRLPVLHLSGVLHQGGGLLRMTRVSTSTARASAPR